MEENGHKETDAIKVELINLGTVNKNKVTIRKGSKYVDLYFSYQTLVSVDRVATTVNMWGTTTGKLLNELCPNHKARVPLEVVNSEAQKRIKAVLL